MRYINHLFTARGVSAAGKPAVLVLLLAACVRVLPAQSQLLFPWPAVLQKYVLEAEDNPSLKASADRYSAEEKKALRAGDLPDPTLTAGYFPVPVETATGPQLGKISVGQRIPWFGKLNTAGAAASAGAVAAREVYRSVSSDLKDMVRRSWLDLYVLDRKIEWTRSFRDIAGRREDLLLRRYSSGQSTHPDLINAQLEHLSLENELYRLGSRRSAQESEFAALLGIRERANILTSDSLDDRLAMPDKTALLLMLRERNPDLARAEAELQAAGSASKLAALQKYPDLVLGLDYIISGEKSVNGIPVAGSGTDPVMLTAGLQIPLHRRRLKDREEAAELGRRAHESALTDMQNSLEAELYGYLVELESRLRSLQLYREAFIPRSLELQKAAEKAYISENGDFLQLLDAERKVLRYRLEYEELLGETYKLYSSIERLTGAGL